MEKGDKPKKKAGAKVKAKLRMEGDVSCSRSTTRILYNLYNYSRMITHHELVPTRPTTTMTSCK